VLPNIKDLQTDPLVREKFIKYSVLDAISTCKLYWELFDLLNKKDQKMEWVVNNKKLGSLSVFYDRYLRYVFKYMCICKYLYLCQYDIYLHVYVYTYIYTYIYTSVYIQIYMCIYLYIYIYT
jgi:hypothetical protein